MRHKDRQLMMRTSFGRELVRCGLVPKAPLSGAGYKIVAIKQGFVVPPGGKSIQYEIPSNVVRIFALPNTPSSAGVKAFFSDKAIFRTLKNDLGTTVDAIRFSDLLGRMPFGLTIAPGTKYVSVITELPYTLTGNIYGVTA